MGNGISKSFKTVSSGVLIASLLTSCTTAATLETEPAIPSSSVVESSVSETTTETTETSQTEFTVETEPHENPFADFISEDPDNAIVYTYSIITSVVTASGSNAMKDPLIFGFDNPYAIKELQDELYEYTGISDPGITLSDVNYFQSMETVMDLYGNSSNFSTKMSNPEISVEALRAVFSYLGLRFGIDEIPASFLIERFPRFYYDEFEGTDCYQFEETTEINDPCVDNETYDINLDYYDSIKEIQDDNLLDIVLFSACLSYNRSRAACIYGHPYDDAYSGFIIQVRDAETGKNVLVPTLKQAEVIQSDINSIPGCEDVDIFVPQTPDDFYAIYGYYPEELLEVREGSVNSPTNAQEYIDYFESFGV